MGRGPRRSSGGDEPPWVPHLPTVRRLTCLHVQLQISSLAERPSQEAITAVLKEASEEGGGLLGAIGLGNVF